jgi:photosystem II stability/assembly factor-like uncharacterized protein
MGALLLPCVPGIGCTGTTGPTSSQSEWTLQWSAPQGYYQSFDFVDETHGWIVGESGRIWATTDGGGSWRAQESGTQALLHCVTFANVAKGWIAAGSNSIGRTTDGGASWIWQQPAGEARRIFRGLSFVDENTGWIVDNFGGIMHTVDGGVTWTPQTSGISWAITSVQFLDAHEGWATATNRVILHTTDGGNTWAARTLDSLDGGASAIIYDNIFFVNREKGWIGTMTAFSSMASHPAPVLSTANAGATWIRQETPESAFASSVVFEDDRVGWCAGWDGILFTSDGGAHWAFQLHLPDAPFVDLSLVGRSHCWALTFTGGVYRYEPR